MKLASSFSPTSVSPNQPFKKWVMALSLSVMVGQTGGLAQTTTVKDDKENSPKSADAKEDTEKLAADEKAGKGKGFLDYDEASTQTRKDARTMSLSIPGLRGQIVDRFGYPFAQNKVIWYPALQMQQFEDESDEFIIRWSREKIEKMNQLFGCNIDVKDKQLIQHYRHRRWIPMPFKFAISKTKKDELTKDTTLEEGIILHPIYQRFYPQKDCAAHIIGYVSSKKAHLERGPINYGDPLFWELEGRGGLEKHFDDVLQGTDGQRKLQYDSHGREVRREDFSPRPGGTVVTTIDMEWQKRAERVLKKHSRRGAFVVIDIQTGEILVMASRPSYDLNLWVPYMKGKTYEGLLKDKSKPLYARAFQGSYPPASAFKIITGIAALDTKAIYRNTRIDCPSHIKLGNHKFWDWSKRSRGKLSILMATALSNNPFFIQVALMSEQKKAGHFMTVASLLGYGRKTGLPLDGEQKGNLLSNEYTLRKYSRTIKQGDIANASIGQGAILASPLQVAQSMAAVANNGVLPKLHIIKQIQNSKGVITMASKPQHREEFGKIDPKAVDTVRHGMFNVVNESYGTGKKGAISYALICGKTGTAQWGPKKLNQNLAWFAGYFPHDRPKYAFAVLYEGAPGEKISGGSKAAPMVPAFFNPLEEEAIIRHLKPNRAMIVDAGLPDELVSPLGDPNMKPAKALIVEDDTVDPDSQPSSAVLTDKPPKALIVEDEPEAPLEPADPSEPLDPDQPAVKPIPKAVIVEEPDEPNGPPLRPLPSGVTEPEEPTEPTDPVEPVKPPKAIPVE